MTRVAVGRTLATAKLNGRFGAAVPHRVRPLLDRLLPSIETDPPTVASDPSATVSLPDRSHSERP
jgi:hypothetical protein